MSWMEFVASLAEHLAWPITAVVMYFLLRERITALVEKVARLKFKDLELDFDKVKQHADAISDATPKIPARPNESPVFSSLEEQILETVERAPAAAILLAWSTVETALASATARLAASAESPSYRSPLHNIEMLDRQGQITKQQVELLHELKGLRNKIAHESRAVESVTVDQALKYADTAIAMVSFLNGLDRFYKRVETPEGKWIEQPVGFKPIKHNRQANFWSYSSVHLANTGLTAGVGPWSGSSADGYAYYGVDIELPSATGSKTVTELLIGLDYVAPEFLLKKAHEVVDYDAKLKVVTFNLGKNAFKYQIKE
jgi:uncharacterized protein YutE (UPF0331/DUF86 family)